MRLFSSASASLLLSTWMKSMSRASAIRRACLGFRQTVFVEIAPYAAAKIFRFADVDDLSLPVFVKVNARLGRKLRYFLTKFHRQL